MTSLPRGFVTFLFTDIEGSSRLWEQDRVAMTGAVAWRDELLADAVRANQGVPFKYVGDMMQAAFHQPDQAVALPRGAWFGGAFTPLAAPGLDLDWATPPLPADSILPWELPDAPRPMSGPNGEVGMFTTVDNTKSG